MTSTMPDEDVEMFEDAFSHLSDDLVLNIIFKLEDDPRHWARLACVSPKFSSLVRYICCKTKCTQSIPGVVSDLVLSPSAEPPGGWASLYKLAVCCPGLLHSGVLLENSDFGLERELGPDEDYQPMSAQVERPGKEVVSSSSGEADSKPNVAGSGNIRPGLVASSSDQTVSGSDCCWSLFDDLLFDTMYDESEANRAGPTQPELDKPVPDVVVKAGCDFAVCKKRKVSKSLRSHLASGVWNLSREQGNKLLASRFKSDCLYICDWPGCIHVEERRNYMLFRGIFKNFKQSRVWRTINDGNRASTDLNCAYCSANHTWDLHSAFCLRRYFGFHDDGEPVVRAYVCENGHVSGAWTDWPLYT